MATTTRETIIANPGRKAGKRMAKRNARRHYTAKQIKAGFGGKRRQNSAKARKSPKRSHRARTTAKKNSAHSSAQPFFRRASPRKRKSSAPKARRKNLGGIFALTGNPAKGHKMAKTKRRSTRKSSVKRSNAGTRRDKQNMHHRSRSRKHNPGQFGGPAEWLTGGIGAVIGGVGAPMLTNVVMGSANTGPVGYFGNAVAVALLAVASAFAAPKQKFLAMGIVFGGVGSIIRRVISDYSLLGSYSSQIGVSGMGDYVMNWNYPIPQYLQPGNNRALVPYGGAPATVPVVNNSAASAPGMGASLYGARLY
jgi:hypothetical protein